MLTAVFSSPSTLAWLTYYKKYIPGIYISPVVIFCRVQVTEMTRKSLPLSSCVSRGRCCMTTGGRADLQATETTDDSSLPCSQLHSSAWPCSGRSSHGSMAAVNLWVRSHPFTPVHRPPSPEMWLCLLVFNSSRLPLYGLICLSNVRFSPRLFKKYDRISLLLCHPSFLEIMTHKPFVFFNLGTGVVCVCVLVDNTRSTQYNKSWTSN